MPVVEGLCERLRVPNDCRQLAMATCRYHLHCHRALEMKASSLVKTLSSLDAIRRPERIDEFLIACEADARGRTGFEDREYPQAEHFRQVLKAMQSVDAGEIAQSIMKKKQQDGVEKSNPSVEIKNAVHAARVSAVKAVFKQSR